VLSSRADRAAALCRQDELIAAMRQKAADVLLATPVVVCCVDEGDAVVDDRIQDLLRLGVLDRPAAPDPWPAYFQRAIFASSLLLENFVEPKVMGRTLDIHPLVVLVVAALGGLLCGIVGLILAEPATVTAATAIGRLRSKGVIDEVADGAEPPCAACLAEVGVCAARLSSASWR
jgi:hypothetical protein